jgi:hypothetical protein
MVARNCPSAAPRAETTEELWRPSGPDCDAGTVESEYVGLPLSYGVERTDGVPYVLAAFAGPILPSALPPKYPEWRTHRRMFYMLYDSSGEIVSEAYARKLADQGGAVWPESDEPCATTEIPSEPFKRGLRLLNRKP